MRACVCVVCVCVCARARRRRQVRLGASVSDLADLRAAEPSNRSRRSLEWPSDVRLSLDGAAIANAMQRGGKGGAADTAARGDGGTGGMSRASSLDILGEGALGMDQSVLPNILTKEEASLLLAYAMPRAYRATHAHHQRGRRRASLSVDDRPVSVHLHRA